MTTVPSNLIPTRITQLPEYQGVSTSGYLPYVIDGVTYKVQFSNIAAVGAVPRVANGLGVTIVSTPKGVMADHAARENNVGGEVLCKVF